MSQLCDNVLMVKNQLTVLCKVSFISSTILKPNQHRCLLSNIFFSASNISQGQILWPQGCFICLSWNLVGMRYCFQVFWTIENSRILTFGTCWYLVAILSACQGQLCQVSVELEPAINSGNIQLMGAELRPLTWCHCVLQRYSRIGRNYSCGFQGVSDDDPHTQWFSFLLNVLSHNLFLL